MRKKSGLALAMALLMLLCLALPAPAERLRSPAKPGKQRLRALLIGCDYFVSQPDTWPAAENNLRLLADTLQTDNRHYSLIRSISGTISTVDAFRDAVRSAFSGARAEDVSLLYISTHGIFDEGASNLSAALLLSDGLREERLSVTALETILDEIPGKKLVILDACNSGAFIGKGLSGGAAQTPFCGPDYKILCSAGGSEASWYYRNSADSNVNSASYFATVLADGLGGKGDHGADANQDGRITLSEIYAYVYDNYAASTPQVYPQQDTDFTVYQYDPQPLAAPDKAVTDITFENTLLTAGESTLSFSFTVQRQVTLYYQLVYHENGAWQFGAAQLFQDQEQTDGTVLPGRKTRTLALDTGEADAYGYAMLQLITKENGKTVWQGARLLCVQPAAGEVHLSVITAPAFAPQKGQELCILAQHNVPCALSVSILDADGKTVRRLSYALPSRPQQLSPAASTFYWDGKTALGEWAPPGRYTVLVKARLGEIEYAGESRPFEVTTGAPNR